MKLSVWLLSLCIFSQTKVDLQMQGKSVDFSTAGITKTFRTGEVLPSTCSIGETFLLVSGVNNFYACVALNTWRTPEGVSYQAGSGIQISGTEISLNGAVVPRYSTGSGTPSAGCVAGRDYYLDTAGQNLYFCSSLNVWKTVAQNEPQNGSSSKTWLMATPGATVGAGATLYGFINGGPSTPLSGSRVVRENVVPENGQIRNCYFKTNGTQGNGSLVATVLVNGVASEIVITVPASSSSGVFTDIDHSVTITSGDLVSWRFENSSSAVSITVVSLSCVLI